MTQIITIAESSQDNLIQKFKLTTNCTASKETLLSPTDHIYKKVREMHTRRAQSSYKLHRHASLHLDFNKEEI